MFTPNEACYLLQTLQAEMIMMNPNNKVGQIAKKLQGSGKLTHETMEEILNSSEVPVEPAVEYNLNLLKSIYYKVDAFCKEKNIDCEEIKNNVMMDALKKMEEDGNK